MKQLLFARPEFQTDLIEELRRKNVPVVAQNGALVLIESDRRNCVWAQASGLDAEILRFDSISQGQKLLRERGRLWSAFPQTNFRRSELLGQDLLQPKARKRRFLESPPQGDLGCYALTGENEMWVARKLTPAIPVGAWEFEESPEAPSRAYLKLWELFTREGFAPKKGDVCLELGSAPGGWTWVLASLGCPVIAVDKGEMDAKVLNNPLVEWRRKDAFALDRESLPKLDWFFSDLICYPPKLLELVQEYMREDRAKNFVCTIKFQGGTDFATLENFLKIPGSRAVHLHHNKHEVTWYLLRS